MSNKTTTYTIEITSPEGESEIHHVRDLSVDQAVGQLRAKYFGWWIKSASIQSKFGGTIRYPEVENKTIPKKIKRTKPKNQSIMDGLMKESLNKK